jgi:hypothetical protein
VLNTARQIGSAVEARIKIADFYNPTRRHTANDGLSPIAFEHRIAEKGTRSTVQLTTEVA